MKKLMMTILMAMAFTFFSLLVGCEKKPVKKVADVNATEKVAEPNKVVATEPNAGARAEFPRAGRRGERTGGAGGRISRFDSAASLKRLDPNDLEKLKKDFPNLDFNDSNAVREDPNVMNAVKELMKARGGFGGFGEIGPGRFAEPNKPAEPNELVALNLKDVEMRTIVERLTEWTNKTIVPASTEIMKQKISVFSPKKLPKDEALRQLYTTLKAAGITHVEEDGVIVLKPLKEAKLEQIPVIPAEKSLADLEDKSLIVQKFFKLESYSATQMGQIIQPLVGEYGYVSADENTRTIVVIDNVGNLLRLEEIIKQFDVPEAGMATTSKIFELKYADPAEIVQLLNQLLSTTTTVGTRVTRPGRTSFGGFGDRSSTPQPTTPSVSEASRGVRPTTSGVVSSVTISSTKSPIILYPEPKRRWIIARASVEDMKTIGDLIEKLDVEMKAESQWETIPLKYARASEVEDAINSSLREMSTVGIQNIYVQPLENAKQLLVFGGKENREIIKKLVEDIDVPAPVIPSKTFKLKYRDADEVKQKIDEHYQAATSTTSSARRMFGGGGFGGSRATQAEEVYVISFPSTNEVTVRAPEATLKQIEMMIEEWDKRVDPVPPRIIELQNRDPVQMVDMLNQLFGGKQGTAIGQRSVIDMLFGGGAATQEKIIGMYYGKVTFQEVPGAKKIIISSKIPEAYDFFEQFVRELDKAEAAKMPKIFTIKYADCEDLAERLNALFNEPGSTARIRRVARGLTSDIQAEATTTTGTTTGTTGTTTTTTEYTPWWSGSGARGNVGTEMPISNVIGKARFVPDPRSKSILVVVQPEYMDGIGQLIAELDKPGKQVMIQAIVVEVDKSKLNSVGMQLASNPTAFGSLGENSITALSQITQQEKHGALIFGADNMSGSSFALNANSNITVLLDFLVKKTDAKILNQQTMWTKDNESAEFFKGKELSLLGQTSVSGTAGIITQSFTRDRVGMTLRARPNITPEKNVDMVMSLSVSQLTQDLVNTQPVKALMDTKTNVIVGNGQTILLDRVILQEDSTINRKLPLLGDLPVVGGVFRHNNSLRSNNELLVFVTPYVIDEESKPEDVKEVKNAKEKMEAITTKLAELEKWLEKVE